MLRQTFHFLFPYQHQDIPSNSYSERPWQCKLSHSFKRSYRVIMTTPRPLHSPQTTLYWPWPLHLPQLTARPEGMGTWPVPVHGEHCCEILPLPLQIGQVTCYFVNRSVTAGLCMWTVAQTHKLHCVYLVVMWTQGVAWTGKTNTPCRWLREEKRFGRKADEWWKWRRIYRYHHSLVAGVKATRADIHWAGTSWWVNG